MRCIVFAGAVIAIGCGGSPKPAAGPRGSIIALEPQLAEESWYRATTICGQGPYEIEIPVASARWGEEIELRLATPRRIALHAVVVADDQEVVKNAAVYDANGRADGNAVENTRCVADLRERRAAVRGGGGGTTAPPGQLVETGIRVRTPDDPPPQQITVTGQLEVDQPPPISMQLVRYGWRALEDGGETGRRFGRIRIRLWSIEPNDLAGVRIGVRRLEWRPNASDEEYERHLARIAAEREARRVELEARLRRQAEEQAAKRRREPVREVVVVHTDAKAELELYRTREAERRRRAEELVARAAAEAERRRRRAIFCNTHPEDRGCWGPGGRRVHSQFEDHARQRDAYCAAAPDDVRCWSMTERARRESAWDRRVTLATLPPKQPDGPPPAALAETKPPKLSAHAEWRDGYWHWTGTTWVWLAGMWRVPEEDIASEQTTIAPEAPPPLRAEAPPPPPMTTTIWVSGFWQWSGTAWVWVPGSWQRPDAGASWRPAEWRPRGTTHILIPGTWVRVRARGR